MTIDLKHHSSVCANCRRNKEVQKYAKQTETQWKEMPVAVRSTVCRICGVRYFWWWFVKTEEEKHSWDG